MRRASDLETSLATTQTLGRGQRKFDARAGPLSQMALVRWNRQDGIGRAQSIFCASFQLPIYTTTDSEIVATTDQGERMPTENAEKKKMGCLD